jgi:stage II sporulation protein M
MKIKKREINWMSWKKTNNYVYSNFKFGLQYIKNLKNYFLVVLLLFLLISLFGFFFPYFFNEQIIKLITKLLKETENLGPLELIGFIIFNNIKSAFFGMIFGVFFGIISIFVVVVNGYVLGFVVKETVAIEGFSVLFRLVPHGIFEIPAVIISLALGLKLGLFLFIYKGKNKSKEFLSWLKDSIKVFVFIIIPLLVIAGIIEGILIFLLE